MDKKYYYYSAITNKGSYVAGVFEYEKEFDFAAAVEFLQRRGQKNPVFLFVKEVSKDQAMKYITNV